MLLEASRSLLGAEDPDTILRITATQLGKLLERPVCFAPVPEHIAPGTLILPPPSQTDYRSCPALHEFSTYEHNLALSILDRVFPRRWKRSPTAPGAKLRKPPARNSCAPTCCAASAMTCAPR